MQFYRKWIPMREDYSGIPNNQQLTFFKKLGFVHLDGSEIDVNGSLQQNIRWRYDNYQTTSKKYVYWTWGTSTDHTHGRWYYLKSDYDSQSITQSWSQGSNNMMAFIGFPLKNRGFYILTYTTSQPERFYYPPVLASWATNFFPGYANPDYPNCLFNFYNNLMNEYNYGLCNYPSFDSLNNAIIDFNYRQCRNYKLDTSNSYTDGKNNICTLIKYPTENGYIDNLYLISTTPKNTTNTATALQAKFFSFGGRNFYCPQYNLAVELPAN